MNTVKPSAAPITPIHSLVDNQTMHSRVVMNHATSGDERRLW